MYQVNNKSEDFYVIDVIEWAYISSRLSKKELISFIAKYQRNYQKHNNSFLANYNATLEDLEFIYYHIGDELVSYTRKKQYVIVDGYFRIIDVRIFKEEIKEEAEKQTSYFRTYRGPKFEYRNGPVPGTGKLKFSRSHRQINIANERRQNCDPEHAPYVRSKRKTKNLPSYDYRSRDRSWKRQSKKRKQWM